MLCQGVEERPSDLFTCSHDLIVPSPAHVVRALHKARARARPCSRSRPFTAVLGAMYRDRALALAALAVLSAGADGARGDGHLGKGNISRAWYRLAYGCGAAIFRVFIGNMGRYWHRGASAMCSFKDQTLNILPDAAEAWRPSRAE